MESSHTIHVAYAEYQTIVRIGITAIINSLIGVHVDIEAGNGKELLNQIRQASIMPDVCILELNMPELNGFDTLIELKKQWPEMKVLVLTSCTFDFFILRMITSGANGYLLKNCKIDEIKKAIYAIYSTGIYYSDIVARKYFNSVINKTVRLPNLTAKEIEVLKFCCTDFTYSEIAKKMVTTAKSVEGYRDSLFKKINTNSRVGLAIFAVKYGLISLDSEIS